jgi:adenylate cyclase
VNPLLCNLCFGQLMHVPGGAEIEMSVLFADVRGSTAIAERATASAFRGQLQHVYRIAASAIEKHDGIIDKFLGDGVMALFIPVIAGADHAGRAVSAGEELLAIAERHELATAGVRIGAGVHAGTAFVGTIGTGKRLDFSALGDTVNVAARLGSVAGPGELLVSRVAWERAGRTVQPATVREIEVAGRAATLEVVVSSAEGLPVAS